MGMIKGSSSSSKSSSKSSSSSKKSSSGSYKSSSSSKKSSSGGILNGNVSKGNSWTSARLSGGSSSSSSGKSSSSTRKSSSGGIISGIGKSSAGYQAVPGVKLSGGSSGGVILGKNTGKTSSSSSSTYRPSSGASNGTANRITGSYTGGTNGQSILKPKSQYTTNARFSSSYTDALNNTVDNSNSLSLGSYNRSGKRTPVQGGAAASYVKGSSSQSAGSENEGLDVPRRAAIKGFTGIYTPNSTGMIKGYSGGKMVDGIIRYPEGVNVDKSKAARAQAFVDYSYGDDRVMHGRSDMAALYGEEYTNEINRLANLKFGEPAWGSSYSGQGGTVQEGGSGLSDRISGGSYAGGGYDYEAALQAAQEASAEALRAQIEQGVNGIYGQKDSLKGEYEQAAQQAYIASMQGLKALPQQLAAQGITGGATESANLALATQYGNNLNQLTNTYNDGLTEIERDAANYRATGNISLAQNAAQYQQQLAQMGFQASQADRQLAAQMELAQLQAQLQAQQAQADRSWQKEFAAYQNSLEYDTWKKQADAKAALEAASAASVTPLARAASYTGGGSGNTNSGRSTAGDSDVRFGSDSNSNNNVGFQSKYNNGTLGGAVLNGMQNQINMTNQAMFQSMPGMSDFLYYSQLYRNGQMSQEEYLRHVAPYANDLGILVNP